MEDEVGRVCGVHLRAHTRARTHTHTHTHTHIYIYVCMYVYAYRVWWRSLKERDHLKDVGIDESIILKHT